MLVQSPLFAKRRMLVKNMGSAMVVASGSRLVMVS